MKQFYTGLVLSSDNALNQRSKVCGRGWELEFQPSLDRKKSENRTIEAVISAYSEDMASKVLKLVLASLSLIEGFPPLKYEDDFLIPYTKQEFNLRNKEEGKIFLPNSMCTPSIPLACALAAKASFKSKWVYAIAKYFYSLTKFPFDDHEPHRSPYYGISKNPFGHVKMVYSILSAYSVIEELGLEIVASSKKPSKVNGQWNPEIKNDLEQRLIRSNINIGQPIIWLIRGPKRRLDKKRSVVTKQKTSWAGYEVQDSKVEIIEAIHYASWLRSKVAAHKVHIGLTDVLKPYDVVNIQTLSRRLILDSLGF